MVKEIITISLKNGIAGVNCYLIRLTDGFILIDTGFTKSRAVLEQKLHDAGCTPDNLRLIVATHGDSDHIGNCRYLREAFSVKIAMHADDVGMAEKGDMFWSRKKPNPLLRLIVNSLLGLQEAERFTPDMLLKDEDDLNEYGLDAKVLSIKGHSKGSIGILTKEGDLFCGDFFENGKKPGMNSIMPDKAAAAESMEQLQKHLIRTVFPGHGKVFGMDEL